MLRRPYFSVLKEGVWADPDRVTRTECVNGYEITGLANAAGIRAALAEGGTVKLNQMEDWHKPSRDLVAELGKRIPAEVKSYVFFTPRQSRGTRPHRDASHVLVVQLAGIKEWRLYATPEFIGAESGLIDVQLDACTHRFTMEPGDLLYLPHGWPHVPHTHDQDSLHLTLTLTEPGPLDLVEALLATFREDNQGLMRQQARMYVEDKAEAVAKALSLHTQAVTDERILTAALSRMRRRIA
ncbi:JmjC domain-containing protein [Nonomuraea sp. KM88]|uniref:JmjC domain-containing protein n=1 Tax=Nonomuraea sp. KM88 TaxID=3457427 RepID=UPI003FCE2338